MNDLDKILLTAAMTIMGGFVIHFLSQLFLKIFIEPLQEYQKQKALAVSLLAFNSNLLSANIDNIEGEVHPDFEKRFYKAQKEIRQCMADIRGAYYNITPHWIARAFGLVPPKTVFKDISNNLLTLSFLGSFDLPGESSIMKNANLAKDTVRMLGADW